MVVVTEIEWMVRGFFGWVAVKEEWRVRYVKWKLWFDWWSIKVWIVRKKCRLVGVRLI